MAGQQAGNPNGRRDERGRTASGSIADFRNAHASSLKAVAGAGGIVDQIWNGEGPP